MSTSIYTINKGINKAIEFRGLKAQYIGYLAAGLVALLILFAVMYVAGLPVWICLPVIGGAGFTLFTVVYRFSHKHGQYGLLKEAAYRGLPEAIVARSRQKFFDISAG